MRKLLLATSALASVAMIATGAMAAEKESPLNVTVGGFVDFRAAQFNFAQGNSVPANNYRQYDFETVYKLHVDVMGKAGTVEYGGRVGMTNQAQFNDTTTAYTGGGTMNRFDEGYVYLANNYGKIIAGDFNGPSDNFVYAPSVGAGQTDGSYTDFLSPNIVWQVNKLGVVDDTEKSTKVAYMTPQLGNDQHKVQAAVSYAPNAYDQGQNAVKNNGTGVNGSTNAPYRDQVEASVNYMGSFDPVGVSVGFLLQTADHAGNAARNRDYTAWGVGGQATYAGFTVGGSYHDAGSFGTVTGQDRSQTSYTAGVTYEWDKVGLGFNWLNGSGYNGTFASGVATTANNNANYVSSFNAYGVGGTYNWFPGMSTNLDAVLFTQKRAGLTAGGAALTDNDGEVIMMTQKLEF